MAYFNHLEGKTYELWRQSIGHRLEIVSILGQFCFVDARTKQFLAESLYEPTTNILTMDQASDGTLRIVEILPDGKIICLAEKYR